MFKGMLYVLKAFSPHNFDYVVIDLPHNFDYVVFLFIAATVLISVFAYGGFLLFHKRFVKGFCEIFKNFSNIAVNRVFAVAFDVLCRFP